MSDYAERPLKVGQRIWMDLGAPVRTVTRVTRGAAYVGYDTEETYEVLDRKTGETKLITRRRTHVEAISPNAFVYPE